MSGEQETPSLWTRITTGAKNFVTHALGYIPRGIVLTGLVFAISAAVEGATGGTYGLGVAGMEGGQLLGRFLGHLALGSMISGTLGATLAPCAPCKQNGSGVSSGNPLISKKEVEMGAQLAKTVSDHGMDAVAMHSGLPTPAVPLIKSALKHTGLGS